MNHRAYLGELCRLIGQLLKRNYREVLPEGEPGFITFVQTFGDLVNFNPHIHVLKHLHHWDPRPPSQAPPKEDIDWPQHSQIPLTYAPLPDIA